MYYKVDGIRFDTAEEAAQEVIDSLDERPYEDMLDEMGTIEICGLGYYPSEILSKVDPIAYRCGMSDYYDSLYSDILYDIERMNSGDTESYYDSEVEAIEEEEPEEEEE